MALSKWVWKLMVVAYGIHVKSSDLSLLKEGLIKITGFDRDLSIAGRAMVRLENGDFVQKLVKIDRPSRIFIYHCSRF